MDTNADQIAKYGKSVIANLYILFRITGIYDSMNETILNTAKRLLSDMERLLQENGEFAIKIIQETFYIEGIRIKAGVSDIESFTTLAEELKKRSIGVLDFRMPLVEADIINLAYAIRRGTEVSDIQSTLEQKSTQNITLGGPVLLQEQESVDLKDNKALARRAYEEAVTVMMETDRSIRAGRRIKLKRIKRALQYIVDSIATDESYLLEFVLSERYEDSYYCHSANISILAVALGKNAGFDRVHLRTLAMAAFFHDCGKVAIPMSILNKKAQYTEKEQELIRRHPVEGIKVILRLFGLSEISVICMFVSFQHHMRLDLSGYPEAPDNKKPIVYSRIVNIVNDFENLVSGRDYERKRLRPNDALHEMLKGSGNLYDPSLMKAFARLFQ